MERPPRRGWHTLKMANYAGNPTGGNPFGKNENQFPKGASASVPHFRSDDNDTPDSDFSQTNRCGLGRVPFAQVLLRGGPPAESSGDSARRDLVCNFPTPRREQAGS